MIFTNIFQIAYIMKNQTLFFFFSLLISWLLNSCSSDDMLSSSSLDNNHVSFEISIPESGLRTRATSDGSLISELNCYVYQVGNTTPLYTKPVAIGSQDGKKGGRLELDLPSGGTFNFVFLATAMKQDDPDSKLYYNPTLQTLEVNYNKVGANDEELDCFFGVLKDINVDKGQSHKITLKRPFAQLNIGTKDLSSYNQMSSTPLKSVRVTVDGVYSSMNVMDGSVLGSPLEISFPESGLPEDLYYPVPGNTYLSMDYLLVNERVDAGVSLTCVNEDGNSFTSEYSDIPLQRNYQTNVFGNLLTKANDFTIEINPDFNSSINKDAEDKWGDYDLVWQVEGNTCQMHYQEAKGSASHTISLSEYIDSDGYIKVTWVKLGLSEAYQIDFEDQKITSALKCDINKLGVNSLNKTFYYNSKLTNVECIKSWNTDDIISMNSLFRSCSSLTSIDISNFNTFNVIDMSYMFMNSMRLTSLNVNDIDTQNVTKMKCMFSGCSSLPSLDVRGWDTHNVIDMYGMFENCSNLTELELSSFDTSNVTNMSNMFSECRNLTSVVLSSFDTSNVTDMSRMFDGCNVSINSSTGSRSNI